MAEEWLMYLGSSYDQLWYHQAKRRIQKRYTCDIMKVFDYISKVRQSIPR